MITWPRNLVNDIARRKTVVFLGSGISRNSVNREGLRPPTWEGFLRMALDRVENDRGDIERFIKEKDYLTACEIIFNKLGKVAFNDLAVDIFQRPGFESHGIHESIFKLDSRIVATPNVDKIYDTYANTVSRATVAVKNYYDSDLANKIRSQDYIIVKVHGTIEAPDGMIFTRRQYTEARYRNASFYQILSALALTHTFVFLGCGLNDPDIRLILESYTFTHPNCRPHYFVTSSDNITNDFKKTISENLSLEMLTYSSQNEHRELSISLANLVLLVEEEREEIASKLNW
ncbi:SIR2 family protein [Brevibacillus brevis]|uniref:SIR2 family protein n=1 Tax=Brevibacillus brevis TaxID=1393 RepID=A0A517IDM7_BREBE|nr:SIR2 family protein [Brevibacillus brevis]QDS36968.1 SIR2 family protein [Brevibacillus brevis]